MALCAARLAVTPLHLQIAIHYHTKSEEQWPMLHIPIHREYAMDLVRAGLLRSGLGLTSRDFGASDGLAIWIDALCATPFPVQRWVMPDPAGRTALTREER